jgi:hypothetical protein
MLSSIHPLGERARHNRWGLTATAHLLGSWLGGLAVFGAAALLGVMTRPPAWLALPAAAAALVLDGRALLARRRVPGPRRQVNEDWLGRYRGWVYGAGFGVQLGAGLVTIVSSAALYLALALTVVRPVAWLLAGTVFGVGRAAPVLSSRGIDRTERLMARHARLRALAQPVQVGAAAALVMVAGVVAVGVR